MRLSPRPARLVIRFGSSPWLLCTLASCCIVAFGGCDSNEVSADDLADIKDEQNCDKIERVSPNRAYSKTLSDRDCDERDRYFALYAFSISEDSDVEVEGGSDDFDLLLNVLDDDGDEIASEFADEGQETEIDFEDLDAGTYAIRIGAFEEDEFGDFDFEVTARASDD